MSGRRTFFLQVAGLAGASQPKTKPLARIADGHNCQAASQELGAVSIGDDSDPYFGNTAWIPTLRLRRCLICGVLWAEHRPEGGPAPAPYKP